MQYVQFAHELNAVVYIYAAYFSSAFNARAK